MPRGTAIYDEARLQGRLWTPALERPALWLDTFDLAAIVGVSGAVSQLTDKSGNGRHFAQGSAGNRPSLDAALQPQSVLWDGSNDALQRGVETYLMGVGRETTAANLPADIYEMAATSLDGVLAMHRAMLAAAAKGGER
jgi:hypothetical protein